MIEQKLQFKNLNFQNNKVFIVAEIGINHLGNEKFCKDLIIAAKKSGADAVKLQIINPDDSYELGSISHSVFKKYILSFESLKRINKFCKKLKIILFATVGDIDSLKVVQKLKFPLIKISSGLNTNSFLINEIIKLKVPLIVSLGMSNECEVMNIYKNLKKQTSNFALLKCTSIYPAPINLLNLNSIETLKSKFNCTIGYSDHTMNELAVLVAVSKGASIIEKHFTTNNKINKADHKISMQPNDFRMMVEKIRQIEKMLGSQKIILSVREKMSKKIYQRVIFSNQKIKKNDVFKKKNMLFKRPIKRKKLSIEANKYKIFLGKKLKKNIKKNLQLTTDLFE